ncbi:DUF4292 domain-containing protein [Dethiosulfatarculus sandiegensis]|uniref:DUF4292 domain-containing protein n=1 Tax=Dethiosulfatarculus sandiegensis TaxID=1429043 RepID=A0A0D2GJH4_9BACT|nr:DUF4292 domain-containing protein [Dethiosulfatarculus sandiegensis]KIX14937.1 hypothetical protein X474_07250 [Dethiosulfatarculus sandiegensis]
MLADRKAAFSGCFFVLAALLFLVGCAGKTPAPLTEMPDAQNALAHIKARQASVVSFSMQGEVEVLTPTEELYGDHHIEAMGPDRIRAEIMGPFGRPVMRLSVDYDRLMVLDYRANRAFRGKATRENMARFLGLYLSPREIYTFLAGSMPVSACANQTLTHTTEPDRARLYCFTPSGKKMASFLLGLPDLRVLGGEIGEKGAKIKCRFEEFATIQGKLVPKRLMVSDSFGREVILINQEVLLNPKLGEDVFSFDIPPEVEVTRLP